MASEAAKIERVLIPIDYSSTADAALSWAVLHGRRFGASVSILHVLESQLHFSTFGYSEPPTHEELGKDRATLDAHVRAHLDDPELKVTTLVEVGDPALKIREVAAREKIDLIIMGTHGRTRLHDLLFGSVTEQVVHHTGCPVLVVPPRIEEE
jgi:universal stress protein A